MKLDKFNILESLKTVLDPISGQDIVSAQRISAISIDDGVVQITVLANGWDANTKANFNFKTIEVLSKEYPEADFTLHFKTVQQEEATSSIPQIKNIIAIGSGKGGVGKSTIAVNLALTLKNLGYDVGILDADLYGPSLPTMLGTQGEKPKVKEVYGTHKLLPLVKDGLTHLSLGYIVDPDQAVVLRGPRLAGIIKQFFEDTIWPPLDILIVDLPPSTGDIQLTLLQTVPVTGAVLVTTPQEVALADAKKAANMFMLPSVNVPILGVVENMAWFTPAELPNNKYYIFGQGGGEKLAAFCDTQVLGQVPLIQRIREGADSGHPAASSDDLLLSLPFKELAQNLLQQLTLRHQSKPPSKAVKVDS